MYFGNWQGSYSGDWFGDGAEQGQAAVPSLFAFWAGGHVGVEPVGATAVPSLFAFWAGGNAGVEPVANTALPGLFAFWAGGNVGAVVETVPPEVGGGGSVGAGVYRRRPLYQLPAYIPLDEPIEEDEALLFAVLH